MAILDQFDPIAIGILDKGDDLSRIDLHRPGRSYDLDACSIESLTCRVGIGDADGDVTECTAMLVFMVAPVVRQFDNWDSLFENEQCVVERGEIDHRSAPMPYVYAEPIAGLSKA